jgi:hypothetical protein
MSRDLIFSIQTVVTPGNNGLRALFPNKDGFYTGVPLAVIGLPSRNGFMYDGPAFIAAMNNPNTLFYKSVVEGNLEGEWGHPTLPKTDKEAMERLLSIDRNNTSHYFSKIWTEPVSGGYTVVYGNVKPCGPKGQFLHESFQDPHRDTAFSLRSATGEPYRISDKVYGKKIIAMCTFDAVGTPGFAQASKRFAIGTESFSQMIEETDIFRLGIEHAISDDNTLKVVGLEHINSQQLCDIFQVDKLSIRTETNVLNAVYDPTTKSVVGKDGKPVSLFHAINYKG